MPSKSFGKMASHLAEKCLNKSNLYINNVYGLQQPLLYIVKSFLLSLVTLLLKVQHVENDILATWDEGYR